jgi:hypothetical protein
MDAEQERDELLTFIGQAYQALGDIACDLPEQHPVEARVAALLEKLSDPWAAIEAAAHG